MQWKTYTLAFCCLFAVSDTHSQGIDSLAFIYSQLPKYTDSEGLIYTDRIHEWAYQRTRESLGAPFYSAVRPYKKIPLRFTRKERRYILTQLRLCVRPYWSDSLFSHSKMIRADSFIRYFEAKNHAKRKILPLLDTPGYSQEFRRAIIQEVNRRYWVALFSKPVYLRGNTLIVWYLESRCGRDCGWEELAVYHSMNGAWEKRAYIFQGSY